MKGIKYRNTTLNCILMFLLTIFIVYNLFIINVFASGDFSGMMNDMKNYSSKVFNIIMSSFILLIIIIGAIKKMFSIGSPQSNDIGNKLIINALILYGIGLIIFNEYFMDIMPSFTNISYSSNWKNTALDFVGYYVDIITNINASVPLVMSLLVGISVSIAMFKKKFSMGNPQIVMESNGILKKSLMAWSIFIATSLLIDYITSIFS